MRQAVLRQAVLGALIGLAVQGCKTTSATGAGLSPREELQAALAQGRGRAVLEQVDELAAKNPRDLSVARMQAEAYVQAGAQDALLTRLARDPSAISHYEQGLVRFSKASEASGPAVEQFRQAIALEPTEPEYHYRLGVALVESEQFEAAVVPLKEATRLAPTKSGWALPLAKALAHTGDRVGAVTAIRTVVTGTPTPAEVKTARVLMDQIVDPFGTVPRAARPRLEQAMQWLEAGDVPQQAVVQLEELAQEYPDQAIIHSLLGLSYSRLDDAGRAVDEFQRAIELMPEDGKNHLYLANLYEGRQRGKASEEQLEKALALNPVLDDAWSRLGDLALERKDLVTARTRYEVVVRLAPDAVPPHAKLASVLQLEHNWPAAERELHQVLDRDPENVEFMLRLGVLHAEHFVAARTVAERDLARGEASKWLEQVLAVQPDNALASRALERVKQVK